jgi:class 3 adenylate cyclase/type IV secretory pathway VirB3-like protein
VYTLDEFASPSRILAHEYQNELLAYAAKLLREQYGDNYEEIKLEPGKDSGSILVHNSKLGGAILVDFQLYTDGYGIEWLVVLAITRSSFIGGYRSGVIIVGVISVIVTLVALVIGLICSVVIVRPLHTLQQKMKLVEYMQLQSCSILKLSNFKEVRNMQYSFLVMVRKLQEYKAFLPSYVLERDFGHLVDDEEHKDGTNIELSHTNKEVPSTSSKKSRISNSSDTDLSIMSPRATAKHNSLALGLTVKQISILVLTINNFKGKVIGLSNEELVLLHGRFLNEVSRIATQTRGDLLSFDETTFVVTWGTIHAIPNLTSRPCSTALSLITFVEHLNMQLSQDGFIDPITISIGISSGEARVGNMGTRAKRAMKVFGTCEEQARVLCEMNSHWKTSILTSTLVHNEVCHHFQLRPLGKLSINNNDPVAVFELVDKIEFTHGEWMYEMVQKETIDGTNKAFSIADELAQEGKLFAAKEALEVYLSQNPTDTVATRLIEIYSQAIDLGKTHVVSNYRKNSIEIS